MVSGGLPPSASSSTLLGSQTAYDASCISPLRQPNPPFWSGDVMDVLATRVRVTGAPPRYQYRLYAPFDALSPERQSLIHYHSDFGHGLGHSLFSEQWPFIAAAGDVVLEEDMMMAFEVPLYLDGIGAFNLEDQVLVTQDGPRPVNRLPRTLVEIG